MTPVEALNAGKERVIQKCGYYITPARMANLMKAAAGIVKLLVTSDIAVNYEECRLVLKIVEGAISEAIEHES